MRASTAIALLAVAALILMTPAAPATTIIVDWSGAGDYQTIQEGMDAASAGDTVLVAPGGYAGPDNSGIDFEGRDIALVSMAGSVLTSIDCADSDRAFLFQNGETAAALVRGFTIERGYAVDAGGAIYCEGASPTIDDCHFEQCNAYRGGAVYVSSSYPTISDCLFFDNFAVGEGGAACLVSSDGSISGCTFDGNTAGNGGALYCESSYPMISGSRFTGNEAYAGGGALHLEWSSPSIQRCTLDGNTAQSAGAIFCHWSTPMILRCTLVGNAGVNGGAMWCSVQSAAAVLENSIIAFSEIGPAVDGFAWFLCSDVYGNEGGDWIYPITDQLGSNGNISQDPLFCEEHSPEFPYTLHADSPCAADNNPLCGTVGEWGVGCPPSTGVADGGGQIESSWGGIKALYGGRPGSDSQQ